MTIKQETIVTPRGEIKMYTLVNACGAAVRLSSLGAGIVSLTAPDRNGKMADVVLGYTHADDYFYDGPCAGKIPGRYANRIARGQFSLDGKDYQLAINNGPNALHGGPEGFSNKLWESEATDNGVTFTLVSPDGDEHYPGTLRVQARYTWSDTNELRLDITATTDKKTVVNLTNHTYWNLAGENSGTALDHELQLMCSRYLPTDETLIPTGEMAPVEDTPMDFRQPKRLGQDIRQDFPALNYGKGYDNCWVVDDWQAGELKQVASLHEPTSGRMLEISTTQPAAQVYTGNWLAGSPLNKGGLRPYNDYDGVAIECQGMPDAPNHPNFPSQVLSPGETYRHTIVFALKTI